MKNYDPENITDYSVLSQHPELVNAAETYITECAKLRGFKPGDTLLGLPLTIPQAAYFRKLGYNEGYAAGQAAYKQAIEKALEEANFLDLRNQTR